MIENGWCKHQVDHLANVHDHLTMSYLATLEVSPSRLRNHTPCLSRNACIAYDTDNATYQTRHAQLGCTCSMVVVPYEDVIEVIQKGGIPLISIHYDQDTGLPKLRVHARKRTSNYVAISHVWADGLGNPNENALPLCQIELLKHRLEHLQQLLKFDHVRCSTYTRVLSH